MLITKTVQEIAELVGGTIRGEYTGMLTGVASLKEAMTTDVAFLGNEKYAPQLLPSKAGVVLVLPDNNVEPPSGRAWILCEDPSKQFSKVVELFTPPAVKYEQGIGAGAYVDPAASLGDSVSIGPNAVISKGAVIGKNSVIGAGCFIGEDVRVGEDCLLYPNVVVRERCILGNRVILHPGVVIGADGFGYETTLMGHKKIPQVGIVQLDDDVEIGANSCVDRARFGRTWIQQGTKIDNLVQVAHNVQIGRSCLLVAQAGVSGSCVLGDGVIVAGQAGMAGHLKLGEGTIVMAQAGVTKDTDPGAAVLGSPAMDRRTFARQAMYINKLPDLAAQVKKMAALAEKVEKMLQEKGE